MMKQQPSGGRTGVNNNKPKGRKPKEAAKAGSQTVYYSDDVWDEAAIARGAEADNQAPGISITRAVIVGQRGPRGVVRVLLLYREHQSNAVGSLAFDFDEAFLRQYERRGQEMGL
jgi:hypothetical protein